MGNSRWRLETSINLALLNAKKADFLDQLEIVVSDWGSEIPLSDVLKIVPEAKGRVKFVHVPPDIAKIEQKDSKFPEVMALNAAARRSSGEYIGRIDNDTVVGTDFFRKFHQFHKISPIEELDLADSFLFVERKSVPYRISQLSLPLPTISLFIERFSSFFKLESATDWGREFWHSPVGIMIFHRDIWNETHGYDERLIYWGWMETDYAIRLSQRHHIINLGDHIGHHFFHLEHYSNLTEYKNRNGAATPRKKNKAETEGLNYTANCEKWGLSGHHISESEFSDSQNFQLRKLSVVSIAKLSWGMSLVIKDKVSEFFFSLLPEIRIFLGKIKRVVMFIK
jgi:GT2 family glycosyltransferase